MFETCVFMFMFVFVFMFMFVFMFVLKTSKPPDQSMLTS